MISVYFTLIAVFACFVIFISDQKAFLVKRTSQTPDYHVFNETANVGEVIASSTQFEDRRAVTSAVLWNVEKSPIDQSDRALTDGPNRFISTFAGTGITAYNGDNIAATSAHLRPYGLKVDRSGDVYLADFGNNRIRKIAARTGTITTIAGSGTAGFNGDNRAATSAEIAGPFDVALGANCFYIAEFFGNRIRKVTMSSGIIITIAGNGTAGYNGDNILSTEAQVGNITSVTIDKMGDVYFTDYSNARVRKVTVSTGIITTIAGNGTAGYNGDNILATKAQVGNPAGIVIDGMGNVYFTDFANPRIRKVTVSSGIITTIAGTGTPNYNGDNIPATSAQLVAPSGITFDGRGNIYFADRGTSLVRMINVSTGIITTIAGNGTAGYNGDNILATSAELNEPAGIAIDRSGKIYIGDTFNKRIRVVYAVASPTASPSAAPSKAHRASKTPTVSPTVVLIKTLKPTLKRRASTSPASPHAQYALGEHPPQAP